VTVHLDTETGLAGVFGKLADPVVTKVYSRSLHSSLQNMADVLAAQG